MAAEGQRNGKWGRYAGFPREADPELGTSAVLWSVYHSAAVAEPAAAVQTLPENVPAGAYGIASGSVFAEAAVDVGRRLSPWSTAASGLVTSMPPVFCAL